MQTVSPVRISTRLTDAASAAAPEKECTANEVGRVKSADSQGDNVVESDR